jgi:hypothetical protein
MIMFPPLSPCLPKSNIQFQIKAQSARNSQVEPGEPYTSRSISECESFVKLYSLSTSLFFLFHVQGFFTKDLGDPDTHFVKD